MGNRVIHFEIQADDPQRAKDFYEKTLGWKIEKYDPNQPIGMEYWVIDTGSGPGISGGLYKRPDDSKNYLYDCTISVDDIDKVAQSIKDNGGEILRPKELMEGLGYFVRVKDPEGNVFGLMQATDWKPQ